MLARCWTTVWIDSTCLLGMAASRPMSENMCHCGACNWNMGMFMDTDRNGLSTGARSSWTFGSHALLRRYNWFPVYLYIELNTCIDVKSYLASTKQLYNIYATSAQNLRRWSNIVFYTNVLCLLGMCCRVAGCIGHGVYTSMIYVHTCGLIGRTFTREKNTLCACMFYSCCNI